MSTKICVQSETKNVVVKVCNVITKVNEAKTFIKHFLCDCKCNFDNTTCTSNQK